MGTCFPASPVTAADRLHEWRLQWTPPTPWFCVLGAENTVILGRQQRLLLALTVTLTWMEEKKTFLKSPFSSPGLCSGITPVCFISYAPPTPEVGLGLKKPSNTILTSEQEAESQFLPKQSWKWKMLQLCAVSQQAFMSLRHTDTKP